MLVWEMGNWNSVGEAHCSPEYEVPKQAGGSFRIHEGRFDRPLPNSNDDDDDHHHHQNQGSSKSTRLTGREWRNGFIK